MTAIVQAGRRHLPRGWADLGLQVGIWFGFLGLYQVVRGFADRNPTQAFENGLAVETSDLMPSMDYVLQLSHLDGMNDIVDTLGVSGNPAGVASAVEFVLEGLHLNRRLNKATGDGPARYSR